MDRSCHKKIIVFILLLLLFFIFGFCGIYYAVDRQEKITGDKMAQMVLQYPNMESAFLAIEKGRESPPPEEQNDQREYLKAKYQYHALDLQSSRNIAAMGTLMMILGILISCFLFAFYRMIDRKEWDAVRREQTNITDCLQSYLAGKYRIPTQNRDYEYEGTAIWEQLKELGLYFEHVKENMLTEEQNTKALITNISHQLKTPLTSLKISLEMMEEDAMEEAEKKEFLKQGKEEVARLEEFMYVLVHLSRLEHHMILVKPQIQNLKEGIMDAINVIIMKAHKKQIAVSLDLTKDILVSYDKRWTTEALGNILDNAVKYSPPNTEIKIQVSDTVHYGLIEIIDEGIGIAKEDYHKIFQRFYRGKQGIESGEEGAGVGLYLARNIIEQQGGTIRVKSKVKGGSLFQIMLPKE